MSPRKKLKDDTAIPSKTHALIQKLSKLHSDDPAVTASGAMDGWRYIDFCDPRTGAPFLALEWLFGCRGLLAGRVMQVIAKYSKGKSSLMYAIYGMAQRNHDAFTTHIETEGAGAPRDFIASFGCDTDNLILMEKNSLEACTEFIDEQVAMIRGGFGGEVGENGRMKKTKFDDPLDPGRQYPIVIGVDSMSALGMDDGVNIDIANLSKSGGGLSAHSRKLRQYFRDRVGRFKKAETLLMLASHETAKINTGPAMFAAGGSKSALAKEAIGIHATYVLELTAKSLTGSDNRTSIGDIVTIKTEKNKLAPKRRQIEMKLVWGKGFDSVNTDFDFLLKHPESPLQGHLSRAGRYIKCPLLSDKSFASPEDFMETLYANTDFIYKMRDAMNIRGYGFAFEQGAETVEEETETKPETTDAEPN